LEALCTILSNTPGGAREELGGPTTANPEPPLYNSESNTQVRYNSTYDMRTLVTLVDLRRQRKIHSVWNLLLPVGVRCLKRPEKIEQKNVCTFFLKSPSPEILLMLTASATTTTIDAGPNVQVFLEKLRIRKIPEGAKLWSLLYMYALGETIFYKNVYQNDP
jgi:hypothetical protein